MINIGHFVNKLNQNSKILKSIITLSINIKISDIPQDDIKESISDKLHTNNI